MKRSKFSDSQIIDAVKRVESGIGVPDICHELGAFGDALQMAGQALRHLKFDTYGIISWWLWHSSNSLDTSHSAV